jgi:hypothetical protein
MHRLSRALFIGALIWFSRGPTALAADAQVPAAPDSGKRVVYLGRNLSDEQLITLIATIAARSSNELLLLDSLRLSVYTKAFLAAYRPDRVVLLGSPGDRLDPLEQRLGVKIDQVIRLAAGPPEELWRLLFPRAEQVVVCPATPRGQLLQAACLAGALHAPLFVTHGEKSEKASLGKWMTAWKTREVILVGKPRNMDWLGDLRIVRLKDEDAVALAAQRQLGRQGRIQTIVATNPADNGSEELGEMSALAPLLAVQKRGALILANSAGTNVEAIVNSAVRREALRQADTLLLVGNLKAIPMEQRPNPIAGDKDPFIEMEPFTPRDMKPATFATGRLFHEDRAVVLLQLARQYLLSEPRGSRRALVASNPGGGLSLLETFSRNTAKELRNAGYETTALFGNDIEPHHLRNLMTKNDVFLWEGHHNTLVKDWGFPTWDEPLPPTFVFLQSCLALQEAKVHPLLSRGAVGVIGSSTRTYSGSGGACSLAFFDAILYENQSVGAALRQAKNFLLTYAMLKEKRLGKDAVRKGANLRAAWSFTLWGDPTLRLPQPERPESSLPGLRHEISGNTIVLELPAAAHARVKTDKYQVAMPPNGRLAGLVRKDAEDEGKPLIPFVFTEVPLPKARPGQTPVLHSSLSSNRWVFTWDERRRCGYLLVTPPATAQKLRFHVEWQKAGDLSVQATGVAAEP